MKYLFHLLLIFVHLSLNGQSPTSNQEAIERANTICEETYSKSQFPGLAVGVALGDKILFLKGYGYSDLKEETAVDPSESLFRIGSVSKTLTSVALGQLIKDGLVNPDKDVREYVKYFPDFHPKMTVAHVAGHLAGVRHYKGLEFWNDKEYEDVKSGIEIFMNDPLLYTPGDKYSYSSYGWNLISAVVEEASEVPFLDFMAQKVFNPAEMKNTFPEQEGKHIERQVKYYVLDKNENKEARDVNNSYKWAGGGFIGTAEDLLKFSIALQKEKILDQETLHLLQLPQSLNNGEKTNYGMGWSSNEDKKGRKWTGHSGGSVGGTTMFLVYPEYDLTVVTLVNQSSARMDQLAWKVANQFLTVLEKE